MTSDDWDLVQQRIKPLEVTSGQQIDVDAEPDNERSSR